MIFAQVVRIAICGDWVLHVVLPLTSCDSALRFSVFTSVQLRISSFFGGGGGCFTKNARKSADLSKNVHFSSSLGRPMETSWRNTASRYCDNVHGYHK